jgi:septal ring factor EnvC (AmiA/AmiB activator)
MLLAASIALTIVVLLLGRSRVESERQRTATALKANDEVKAQLKAAQKKIDEAQESCSTQAESSAELSRQIVTLELEKRRLQEELAQAQSKGGKK